MLPLQSVDELGNSLGEVSSSHIMGLFSQMMRKVIKHLQELREKEAAATLPVDSRVAKVRLHCRHHCVREASPAWSDRRTNEGCSSGGAEREDAAVG
jgi:hypothetical protein